MTTRDAWFIKGASNNGGASNNSNEIGNWGIYLRVKLMSRKRLFRLWVGDDVGDCGCFGRGVAAVVRHWDLFWWIIGCNRIKIKCKRCSDKLDSNESTLVWFVYRTANIGFWLGKAANGWWIYRINFLLFPESIKANRCINAEICTFIPNKFQITFPVKAFTRFEMSSQCQFIPNLTTSLSMLCFQCARFT